MKLDILKKLTALANNNPNEHEANLAARRVCKMLEECNFNLVDTVPPNDRSSRNQKFYEREYNENLRYQEDILNYFFFAGRRGGKTARTWNDVHRSEEPQWKSTPPPGNAYNPFRKQERYYNPIYKEQTKPIKEKRTLKCTKCGKKSETVFIGHPDVYECNSCQWTEYTKSRVK